MSDPLESTLALAPPRVHYEVRDGGISILRSAHPLGTWPRHLSEMLRHWARQPDRTFLVERGPEGTTGAFGWNAARTTVDALAQALFDRGLGPARPLMVLSENSIAHALYTLAAMQIGAPVSAISTAYSLLSLDFAKLRSIHAQLRPAAVFTEDPVRYGRALDALGVPADQRLHASSLSTLAATVPRADSEAVYQSLTDESIAKILFTSGSTGEPKGVITTQRMVCSNQRAIEVAWPFLHQRRPVVLDWLPWSHTFGANHNFNMVLFHGGTLFIDDGRPTPDGIARTVRNVMEMSPSLYFNVPRGYEMLVPWLERDDALAHAFFQNLDALFYAAASLGHPIWERLENVSVKARGTRVRMLSAWGLTETSPLATTVHFPIRRAGVIGLPAPGTEIKLVPTDGKLEIRVRGPNVTPGYWQRDDLTREAFDDEGFFRTGDAVRWADLDDPEKGLVFDGRIAENFKLTSGTWVHVGALRIAIVSAAAPWVQDAVIAGLDRAEIGALLFLSPAGAAEPSVRAKLTEAFQRHNAENPGSSQRIARAIVLPDPPTIDAGEITDKGYVNQRAVLARRMAWVERLFRDDDPDVLTFA